MKVGHKVIHERKRAKLTGRGKGHTFLGLPHHVINSEEFGALGGNAVKMLIELARQYKGANNGDLSAPWSVLRTRGWKSKATVSHALHELLTAAFIVVTFQGGKHRVCSRYAVTWKPIDDCHGKHHATVETVPSNRWRKTETQVAMRTSQVAMRTSEPKKRAA